VLAPTLRSSSLFLMVGLLACSGGGDDSDDTTAATTSGVATAGDTVTTGQDDAPSTATAADTTSGSGPTTDATATTNGTNADTDTGEATTTGAGGDPGAWLVTVDNAASPSALVRQDLDTGATTSVCTFPNGTVYGSIEFARDGTLYGHNVGQSRIDTINPCNCGFQVVGPTSVGPLVLAVDADDGMLAIEPALDALVSVDLQTGLANVIGGLGLDFGGTAAAWSDNLTGVYAIDDTTDTLYAVSETTGLASTTVALSQDVTTPGLAVHPDGTFYACNGASLYELDTFTGELTQVGTLDLAGACTNLTAPRTAVACLDGR
jgi:hypothetical protein